MSTFKPKTTALGTPLLTLLLALLSPLAYAQTPTGTAQKTSDTLASGSGAASDAALRSQVEQLTQLLREQQKRIDALEAQRQAAPSQGFVASSSATLASADPGPANQEPAPAAGNAQAAPAGQNAGYSGSSDERIRNLERQIKGIGPISFSGDIRLRAEPFFGGPSDESQDRARGRIRTRFNALANLGEQFRAGFTLASGDINDPISANQTLTGFYTRKAIALDQAFVEYKPKEFKPLTLVGGKFRYPWYNTELTWDKDLNPEGTAETLAFKLDTPVLKRVAVVGFQLPFAELAGTSANGKRINQQITYGGQLQATFQITPRLSLRAYSGYYDFFGADSVAIALAKAGSKNPQTPLTGLLALNSSNPVQNSTYTTTATTVITIDGKAYPTGVSTTSNAQFASKFGLFDSIAQFDLDTGNARWPLTFIGDYVQNTEACANLKNIVAVPANTSTTTYKQTVNAKCNSHERRGYWAEARAGRLQEKGDFQIGYTRIFIDREAVLGNFNYSDIRQGTNVTQHRFMALYQFDKSVQLGFTALVGRPIGSTEPWLTRLQFDSTYIF